MIRRTVLSDGILNLFDELGSNEGLEDRRECGTARLDVTGNLAVRMVSRGNGGECCVVQIEFPRLCRGRMLTEEEGDLAEERGGGRKHAIGDPAVEIVGLLRKIVGGHFARVRCYAADDRERVNGRPQVVDSVELTSRAKVEGRYPQIHPRPTAKRRGAA